MRAHVNRLYQQRRGTTVGIDPAMRPADLAEVLARRAVQLIRGCARGHGRLMVGKGVTIKAPRSFRYGKSVVLGDHVTIDAMSRGGISLGDSVTIDAFAQLRASGTIRLLGNGIEIGPRTAIGAFNMLLGAGGLQIGSDCLLGPNVTLVTDAHGFRSDGVAIRDQGEELRPIRVGNDVWLGSGVIVLGGVTIGDGSVVGAGSVVTKSIEPSSIMVGTPAKKVGVRGAR